MKFLNRLSIGCTILNNIKDLTNLNSCLNVVFGKFNLAFQKSFLPQSLLLLFLMLPALGWGQQVVFNNVAGKSYTNTKARTFDLYGPVTVQCSSIDFTLSFNFSRPWSGSGNMESNDECSAGGGCVGDPENSDLDGCDNCWDFIWVKLLVNGNEVFSDLIGTNKKIQTGTISTSGVATNPGDVVEIEVYTQTWASDESITFNNIRITGAPSPADLLPLADPYCRNQGSISLVSSQNGLTGTWSGPGVSGSNFNTNTAGAGTHTLTFTPAANQCATPNTIMVQVDPLLPAQLEALGPYCLNSGNIQLPTDQNGITGNWTGTGVSSNRLSTTTAGSRNLTFTPTAGQCATAASTTVQITAPLSPTFTSLGPYCQGQGTVVLPTTDDNGISGTWTGTGVTGGANLNTGTGGTGNRTLRFTPGAGQCATARDFVVSVQATATPSVTTPGPFCTSATPVALSTTQGGQAGNWSGAGVSANRLNISTAGNKTITFTPTDPCYRAVNVVVAVGNAANITPIANQTICGNSFTLPMITASTTLDGSQAYFTGPNGTGTRYTPGSAVSGNQTLFAYYNAGGCSDQKSFTLTFQTPPKIDSIRDTTTCGSFILPIITGTGLTNGAFYTQTMGGGTRFNSGQVIDTTQTLFVYDNNGTCSDQDTFRVNIVSQIRLDSIPDVQVCTDYVLPTLTGTSLSGNQAYYTETNGGGSKYLPGQRVVGDVRLYAFDQVPGCSSERTFLLDTLSPPQIDSLPDTTACGSIQLPLITGRNLSPNAAYFSGTNGTGLRFAPGQNINFSGNLFAFDQNVACKTERTFNVSITPGPQIELLIKKTISCNGSKDGALDLRINNSFPPLSFSWNQSNLNGIEDPDNLGPGTYTVTVTDGTGCEVIASVTLNEPAPISLSCAATKAASRIGSADAEANINIGGGTPRYSLMLTGPVNQNRLNLSPGTLTLTGLSAGDYKVVLTDSLGCSDSCNFTITQPVCNLALGVIPLNPACFGEANGQITVNITGGAFPFRIDWDQDALDGQLMPQNLRAGVYRLVLEDNVGCQIRDSVRLLDPAPLVLNCIQQNAVTRVRGNDGQGTLNLSGGTRPYRVSWTGPSTGNFSINRTGDSTLTGLRAGQYRIEVRDRNDCVDSCVLTISEPLCSLQASINVVKPILCSGNDDGSLEALVQNGRAPLAYRWTGDSGTATTNRIQNLSPALYTLIVTDNIGCSDTTQFDLLEPTPLVVNCEVVSNTSTVGGRDGQVKLRYSGGTGTISLDWGGAQPGNVIASSQDSLFLGNLPPGTYSTRFIDANGCPETCAFNINEPVCNLSARLLPQSPTCTGSANGQIAAIVNTGVAPFNFQWGDNSNNDTLQNVSAGIYQVTITDSINCRVVLDTTLIDPAALKVSCQVIQQVRTINGSEGRVRLTFSGGSADYTISLRGPVSTSRTENTSGSVELDSLSSGNYIVIFTDSKGCEDSCSFRITEPTCTLVVQSQANNPLCDGSATGEITVTVTGGKTPFQYDWSDNASDGQATARNLRAGTYTLALTDSIGCVGVDTIVLASPAALNLTCSTPSANTMVGGQNGSIVVRFNGGTAPYKLILSGAKRDSFLNISVDSFRINNLSKGNYRLSLTDANGCTIQGCDFQINDPVCDLALGLSTTNNQCAGTNQGNIQSTLTGGQAPYSFDWSDDRFDGNSQASGLSSGTYQLIITDAQLCRDTATVTLIDPPAIETICSVLEQPRTLGGIEGRASVVIRGGTGQRNIQLSGPSPGQMQQISVDTFSFSNLAAGTYQIVVTDANACTDTCGFTLLSISCNLQGSSQVNNPNCNGTATGNININVVGNSGAVVYTWSNPALNGSTLMGLSAGNYRVTLTDAALCRDTLSITLSNPPQLTLAANAATQPTPARPNGGSISLNYSGGTPGYQVNWSPNGNEQRIDNTSFTIQNLSAGVFNITLTDSKGCTAQAQITLTEPPCNVSVAISSARADCESSHLNTAITGGRGPYQYTWNSNRFNGQANPRNVAPGVYRLTLTDATGCVARDSIVLAADPLALQVSFGIQNPPCPGDFGIFNIRSIGGGQGPFVLALGSRNPQRFNNPPLSIRDLSPGTFNLNITNASGCSFDTSITVAPARNLNLELGQDTTLRRGAKITFRPNVNFIPVQINWSPSEGLTGAESLNPQATPTFTTTYTLLLSDSLGCEVSDKIQVLVAGQVEAYFPSAFSPNGDNTNDYFSAFANTEDIERLEYLRIFDRWGNLVFEGINVPLNDPSKGWDGTSNGQPSPIGLYVFSSLVRLRDGSTYQKAGEVNLIR